MRKLLIFLLVFGMASLANATVIDVVTVGLSDLGHSGYPDDPLHSPGESVEIKIVLNHNPYPGFPSYDGYLLSSMDTMLSVSSAGSLEMRTGAKNPWVPIPGNEITLSEEYLTPLRGPADIPIHDPFHMPGPDPPAIVDLRIAAVGMGSIILDLSINGLGEYANYTQPGVPLGPYPDPPGWLTLVEGDLGDLALYSNAIPEPATVLLLGFGGLALLRKRRK